MDRFHIISFVYHHEPFHLCEWLKHPFLAIYIICRGFAAPTLQNYICFHLRLYNDVIAYSACEKKQFKCYLMASEPKQTYNHSISQEMKLQPNNNQIKSLPRINHVAGKYEMILLWQMEWLLIIKLLGSVWKSGYKTGKRL